MYIYNTALLQCTCTFKPHTYVHVHVHMYVDCMFHFILSTGGLWRLEYDVSLSSVNVSILSGCGDNLMDTVCRDACNGHDIPKVRKRKES